MSFNKILIAVDEGIVAAHAAEVGIELAASLRAEVAFITVMDTSIAESAPDSGVPADQWITMAEQDARNLLAGYHDRALGQPLTFLERGKPAAEILKAAANWPADMIVIGTQGRGAVGNILLGSVAQGVLHRARCPILIVRAET